MAASQILLTSNLMECISLREARTLDPTSSIVCLNPTLNYHILQLAICRSIQIIAPMLPYSHA